MAWREEAQRAASQGALVHKPWMKTRPRHTGTCREGSAEKAWGLNRASWQKAGFQLHSAVPSSEASKWPRTFSALWRLSASLR
eukprot:10458234-Lingulodinium_polyedra.AAC.1